jgi:hypothetical protein
LGVLTLHARKGGLQRLRAVGLALLAALLQACAATGTPESRAAQAMVLAAAQGWQPRTLTGPEFDIVAFVPGRLTAARRLTVYIEGDGLSWVNRHTPSFAPTPADPLALRLAMADPSGQAVYLARPCQYTQGASFRNCHPRYWGSHRFAPQVIGAMDQALSQLQHASGATELVLVGYSGGAAVAALVAARRRDVVAWVSVAGTLDTDAWTRGQRLAPLTGSLNPSAVAAQLRSMPQWHFVGERDSVVPPSVLEGFLQAQAGPVPGPVQVQVVEGFDHQCCWVREWPRLSQAFSHPDTPP